MKATDWSASLCWRLLYQPLGFSNWIVNGCSILYLLLVQLFHTGGTLYGLQNAGILAIRMGSIGNFSKKLFKTLLCDNLLFVFLTFACAVLSNALWDGANLFPEIWRSLLEAYLFGTITVSLQILFSLRSRGNMMVILTCIAYFFLGCFISTITRSKSASFWQTLVVTGAMALLLLSAAILCIFKRWEQYANPDS